jgi:hypothetical protein
MVRFRLAAFAAFLTFFLAAAFCFALAMLNSRR